ncbi:DNA-binding transcriptional LysR family regulator [Sinobacterium caligoides]|uniref:DNA-binding transcriptional LysR family regulator n=1 Tax=Sinobacterium caligoides TaxID=933926 RepID=A0A3N2DR44_9GAMM|nr:LysR family transcriptional regulator [Sinobacterium caligoides]ROS02069.1 DNA-binding transcriptional LysR family regulator [Sinobacterium caligoides]
MLNKKTISLPQMRSFCALAKYRSFKLAAEKLLISQPSLVNQIATIEEVFNTKLFIRQRENNRLTELGLELLPSFQGALNHLKDAEYTLLARSSMQAGEISLAAVSPYRVSLLIKEFNQLYPNIKVKVSFSSSEQVQNLLSMGEVDAAFLVQEQSVPGQQAFFFYEYSLVAMVPKSHPLAVKETLSIDDFDGAAYLSREDGSLTRSLFETALRDRQVIPNRLYELGSRESIREAVAQGLGISVVANYEHVPHDNIRLIDFSDIELTAKSTLVVPNERVSTPLIRALINVVDHCRQN